VAVDPVSGAIVVSDGVLGQVKVYRDPACSNGVDDDHDGLADAADPGCESPADSDETDATGPPRPVCSNGADDDGDGLVDQADPGCESPADGDETVSRGRLARLRARRLAVR
jgi:hypothetical protein